MEIAQGQYLATVRLFGSPDQWQPWFELTARQNWFWGNALNPLDTRTVVRNFGGWREFSGKKSFCSGASDSQMLSATFERVRVEESDLLLNPGPLSTPFACLRPLIAQLHFAHIFLGITQGAFEEARHYTLTEMRPWFKSGAAQSHQDPYVLEHYGDFWVGLESARLLLEHAALQLDRAWIKGPKLTAEERGHVAVSIATAKVAAHRHGCPRHPLCRRVGPPLAQSAHAELARPNPLQNQRTG